MITTPLRSPTMDTKEAALKEQAQEEIRRIERHFAFYLDGLTDDSIRMLFDSLSQERFENAFVAFRLFKNRVAKIEIPEGRLIDFDSSRKRDRIEIMIGYHPTEKIWYPSDHENRDNFTGKIHRAFLSYDRDAYLHAACNLPHCAAISGSSESDICLLYRAGFLLYVPATYELARIYAQIAWRSLCDRHYGRTSRDHYRITTTIGRGPAPMPP